MHRTYIGDLIRNQLGLSVPLHRYAFYKLLNGRRLIFIHIPKTAGTSIARALKFPPPNPRFGIEKHITASEIIAVVGEEVWKESFKFAFVRNPWSRLYSQYRYRINADHIKSYRRDMDFNTWCKSVLAQRKLRNFRPQTDWLGVKEKGLELDFIGRFEELESDMERLADRIGAQVVLPHLLPGGYTDSYREIYTAETAELVRKAYRSDIEAFNYEF